MNDVSLTLVYGFLDWILSDVSYRQDDQGQPLKRGQRRHRVKNGQKTPYLIFSRKTLCKERQNEQICSICWQNSEVGRGTDFSFRITLAVLVLMKGGASNWNACVAVADHETAKQYLKETTRGQRTSRRDDSEETKRIKSVRSMVNRYQKQALKKKGNMEVMLEWWLRIFRFTCLRDEEVVKAEEVALRERVQLTSQKKIPKGVGIGNLLSLGCLSG